MKNNIVLVVSVHPDDEVLAAGGTLKKHQNNGDELHWLIVTNISEDQGFDKRLVKKRQLEIEQVATEYSFVSVSKLDIPTTTLEDVPKGILIDMISKVFAGLKPSVVYLPFPGDAHSSHKYVFDCSYPCTKSFRYPFVKEVYAMETISETEFGQPFQHLSFVPNIFVDISPYMKEKIRICSIYESEIGEHPFPRSSKGIEALAILRGSQSNCEYAEAFIGLKIIK